MYGRAVRGDTPVSYTHLFGLAAGLLWTAAYGALFQAPARALAGYEGPVEVTVADWPQATAYGSSVLVRPHPGEGWPDVYKRQSRMSEANSSEALAVSPSVRTMTGERVRA